MPRGKSYKGKLPKVIIKGKKGKCKVCGKTVEDLKAHKKAKHMFEKA